MEPHWLLHRRVTTTLFMILKSQNIDFTTRSGRTGQSAIFAAMFQIRKMYECFENDGT